MSKEITAYFKGRTGVAESVYQHDYGRVLVFDDIELPSVFEVHFEIPGDDEAIIVAGQDNRAAIPNVCLDAAGIVTAYVYAHEGQNDGETEYIVRFNVMHRAKPVDDGTEEEQSFMSDAIALMQHVSIEGEVANWLDDHPEATTTVQDGAITTVKLHDGAVTTDKIADGAVAGDNLSDALRKSPFYDVTRYGILPDTDEDLYEALFDFLHDVVADTGGVVYFPCGTYIISDCIFIPANTIFMGEGAGTIIKYTEEYNAMGVGLSNGGSNVCIMNMTVDCNTTSEIEFGAMTGSIGFGTYTFDSWDAYHKSPSSMSHADCVNVCATDLWTNTRYILQTETGTGLGTVTGVVYRNIYAEKSLVSIMGRDAISDVTIENVKCAFLRIGTDATLNNNNVRVLNVSTGRMFLRGDGVSVYDSALLPELKYDSSTTYTYAVLLEGDVRMYNCDINASEYVRCFSRMSAKLFMVGVKAYGSSTQVISNSVGTTDPNFANTHIIGCRLETSGSSGSIVYGRIDSTYFPTLGSTSKIQGSPIGRQSIETGTDFDDITSSGRYYATGTIANSMLNRPEAIAVPFFLDVDSNSWADNSGYIVQKITSVKAAAVYIRARESGTWTSWYKYAGTQV